jgi:hypothetical protein
MKEDKSNPDGPIVTEGPVLPLCSGIGQVKNLIGRIRG